MRPYYLLIKLFNFFFKRVLVPVWPMSGAGPETPLWEPPRPGQAGQSRGLSSVGDTRILRLRMADD